MPACTVPRLDAVVVSAQTTSAGCLNPGHLPRQGPRVAAMGMINTTEGMVATLDPLVLAELIRLAATLRTKTPDEIASADVLQSRRQFLRESIGETQEADTVFERIVGGDELQPVSYLERGMIAARAVTRLRLGPRNFGTGFLIAPRVLLTNNHV